MRKRSGEKQRRNKAKWLRKRFGLQRKRFKPNPVPWVRPDYDDFPAVTLTSVERDYDPTIYGFPPGTDWPRTAEEAQARKTQHFFRKADR